MNNQTIQALTDEIANLKETREMYKKRFWIKSGKMDRKQQQKINKLFTKIDRLRNHLTLWLKHLVTSKPSNYDNCMQLINRGRREVKSSFKQLEKALQN